MGTNYGGVVGGNWVAELGVLGEHGRCDGGRREVAGRACPAPTGVMVEGAVYFQHPAHVNVENTCNFYLIIIV